MTVLIENSADKIQQELLVELEKLERQLGLVGQGFLAGFQKRMLEKQIKKVNKKYWQRAYQLGREARFYGGSHG